MKNLKRCLAVLLAAAMMLAAVGCGKTDEQPKETQEPKEVTIVDQAGREVTVGKVETIALAWYMANDFPLALGVGDRIVAVGPYDDFQKMVVPAFETMDTVGRGKPDLEKMAAVNPDLFIHKAYDTEGIKACEELGIPTIGISPEDVESTLEILRFLGEALGVSDRAEMLCNYYSDIMKISEDYLKNVKPEDYPTFLMLGQKSGSIADGSMMQAQMISSAGGKNLAEDMDAKEFWPVVGLEQIFQWDPDFLFLSSSFSSGGDYTLEDIMSDPAWAELKAVKAGHVYMVPSTLHAWENPGLAPALGTVWSMMKMYPDSFEEAKFDELVKDFYKTVYNLEIDRETLGY